MTNTNLTLVKDLDTLEESKEITLDKLDKKTTYSIRVNSPHMGPLIKPEASFSEIKKIVSEKEYQELKIYIKKGSYYE